jgi:hypothetical protein
MARTNCYEGNCSPIQHYHQSVSVTNVPQKKKKQQQQRYLERKKNEREQERRSTENPCGRRREGMRRMQETPTPRLHQPN